MVPKVAIIDTIPRLVEGSRNSAPVNYAQCLYMSIPISSATLVAGFPLSIMNFTVRSRISSVYLLLLLGIISSFCMRIVYTYILNKRRVLPIYEDFQAEYAPIIYSLAVNDSFDSCTCEW